jgi:hypothetical protein
VLCCPQRHLNDETSFNPFAGQAGIEECKLSRGIKVNRPKKGRQRRIGCVLVAVLWAVTPCSLVVEYRASREANCFHLHDRMHPEDGGSMFLRKDGTNLTGSTAS